MGNINHIKNKYNELSEELKEALSKMELTDKVIFIRQEILKLQSICPHDNGTYSFTNDEQCPYCGKKFKE